MLAASSLATAATVVPTPAAAQTRDARGNAASRGAAARAFTDGQAAFARRDFKHAAESFEVAYKLVPHPDALWNAARSWYRAGENARAANLYVQYLEEAPPDAPDRNTAIDELRELATGLTRLEIHAIDVEDVRLDGERVSRQVVYANPGVHLIQGRRGEQTISMSRETSAGTTVSIALTPPEPAKPEAKGAERRPGATSGEQKTPKTGGAPPPKTGSAPSRKTAHAVKSLQPASLPPAPSRGLSPLVLLAGGGLTAGAAAALIWSGLDTLDQKRSFDEAPTQENLDFGRDKQLRTNVLLGVTAGLGLLTISSAIFLVDWQGGREDKAANPMAVGVGVGPGFVAIRKVF